MNVKCAFGEFEHSHLSNCIYKIEIHELKNENEFLYYIFRDFYCKSNDLPDEEVGLIPSWLSWPLSELAGPPWWLLLLLLLVGLPPLPARSFPLSSDLRCSAASIDFRCIPAGPQSIRLRWLFSNSWLKPLVLEDCADRDGQKKSFRHCFSSYNSKINFVFFFTLTQSIGEQQCFAGF